MQNYDGIDWQVRLDQQQEEIETLKQALESLTKIVPKPARKKRKITEAHREKSRANARKQSKLINARRAAEKAAAAGTG